MKSTSIRLSSLLLAASFASFALAGEQSICASYNTASGSGSANNYQSNGACTKTCGGYAFAIVQYKTCWCSNIAPDNTVSLSQCNEPCPGYPYDKCGNGDSGLYGYIPLGKDPQGTAGSGGSSDSPQPASSSPASSPSSSPAEDTVTSLATVVSTQVSSVVSVEISSVVVDSSPPTTSSPIPVPVQSTQSPTWTPTPSLSVMTVSGSVQTIVVTPSAPPRATTTVIADGADGAQADSQQPSGFFSNKGAVAGVFTVVGLVVAGLIGAALFFFFRRRNRDQEGSERLHSFEEERGSRPPTFMSRRPSELGLKTDLAAAGRAASDEKTPTSTHLSGTLSRRTSIPLTDSRLNAAAMFHDNGSHMSVASLQDNHDYTRPVLQVANPDRPGSSAIEDD